MKASYNAASFLRNVVRRGALVFLFLICAAPVCAQTDYLVVDVDDLFGLWYSESDWGDFDNDGDLDLLMAGYGPTSGQGYHKFYRNDGNSAFALLDLGITGTGNGSVAFADLDGDNDLDAFVCGQSATVWISAASTLTRRQASSSPTRSFRTGSPVRSASGITIAMAIWTSS
ncbi:MAG TPA: VCBS repeat-containing protein [Candidatus Syntrophosphaera sp.]|nr:VCBS repeat-containing protein [Candidatus Syntrophosphaera sp.]